MSSLCKNFERPHDMVPDMFFFKYIYIKNKHTLLDSPNWNFTTKSTAIPSHYGGWLIGIPSTGFNKADKRGTDR